MAAAIDDEFDCETSARVAAKDRKIRAWFEANADDPDFITSVQIVKRDLLAAKAFRGGAATTDPHDVTLCVREKKMRIPLSRWRPLIDRGYIENSTRPALTAEGERLLTLYEQLLQDHEASSPGAAPP